MRTAVYIRVSTQEQAKEGFSISAQRERLTAYATSQGWDIVGFYVDEGLSAKDTNRDDLQRMLKDIEDHLIDVVLVYKLDRLTRSVLDLYELLKFFDKHSCKFKSATEVYDTTTAMGRLFVTIVAALAQWERENLGERVSMGMEEKVRQGQWHGSTPGFGFDYINKEIVINENEVPILRLMFDWYINEGLSDRYIAIKLNQEGYKAKNGGNWNESSVRRILTNPIAIGELRWNVRVNKDQYFTVPGAAPVAIDPDIFYKAQEIREKRRKFNSKQATSDFIYSGILTCSRCGSTFKGHIRKSNGLRHKSYRCRNVLMKKCDMPMVSEKIVEQNFIDYLKQLNLKDQTQSILIKEMHTDKQERKIKTLNDELEKIKSRRKKWQYAWANEMIQDGEFKQLMSEEQQKENDILAKLKELNVDQKNHVINHEVIDILSDAIRNWKSLSEWEKKQLLQLTVHSIVVDKVEAKKRVDRLKILEVNFN